MVFAADTPYGGLERKLPNAVNAGFAIPGAKAPATLRDASESTNAYSA
jgi:hypothetical protein